ncbi:gag-protease polyprotein [Cucumis melo var. makuwa]|uniref:Gag-protease polyprotein n=1 Tax=Cucumis melo var. makuwa TaxID=1194695 RepID=A0A5D3C929_CUCMM|nr:gag-protease polyprotein [Cucumis melo var. makuwa]
MARHGHFWSLASLPLPLPEKYEMEREQNLVFGDPKEHLGQTAAVSIPIIVGFATPATTVATALFPIHVSASRNRPTADCLTQPADCRLPLTQIVASDASFSSSQNNQGEQLPSVIVHSSFSRPRAKPQIVAAVALSRPACSPNHLSLPPSTSGHGIRELTLKFSGSAAGLFGDTLFTWVDSLGVDSSKGHNQVSGSATASCSLCAIVCKELFTDRHRCPDVLCIVVVLVGYVVNWNCMSVDFKVLMLGASFEITRLIRVSFEITRLVHASFGIMRLMCAFYGTTRLFMYNEGQTDEGQEGCVKAIWTRLVFFMLPLMYLYYSLFSLSDRVTLKRSLPLVREMPPRRDARRGGRGGRGTGAGRVQPEMREQQQPAPLTPAPIPVVPQVVPDLLSAEAKHLRDFRKYNPTTFDGSLEDPTRAQLWLSSLETIFRYMKCLEDQKVQCIIFMLTDRGTAWWETTERMLGGDVGQITWQQFKESFYAKFFSASLRDAKRQEFLNLEQDDMTVEQYDAEFDMLSCFAPEMIATEAARAVKFVRGLRLDIQSLVRAFRPATHADALRLAVDLSLQKRANSSKVAGRGSTSGQKKKAEQQPTSVPQRNLRSGGEFRRFQQKPFEAKEAARGKPLCTTCGKHHLGRCLFGTKICFKCRQEGHTADRCSMRLTGNA